MFKSSRLFSRKSTDDEKSSYHAKQRKQSKARSATITESSVYAETGQKHRAVITHLLSMTLSRERELDLLWFVAKGFDLPLVIGEHFIAKSGKFQSASYHDCLQYTLTTLFHEDFAQQIWQELLSKIHEVEKCQLALVGLERTTRKANFKKYPNCFIGKEAVDWLVAYKFVSSREDALRLGGLWEEMELIDHVTSSHYFKDENLFYRFNEEEIYKKCKLLQQARFKSRSNTAFPSPKTDELTAVTAPHLHDDIHSTQSLVRNKSSNNVKKRKGKKKSKASIAKLSRTTSDGASKPNSVFLYDNVNSNTLVDLRSNTLSMVPHPQMSLYGSANTLIDIDYKYMQDHNMIHHEWSDSEKEQGDIVSEDDIKLPASISPKSSNQKTKRHRKKRSFSGISMPWFG